MFSALILVMLSISLQGNVSSNHAQGSRLQVQDDVYQVQVQTDLEVVNSESQADGLTVQPVNNPTLVPNKQ